jgi:DNA uptake protein ComE-like DNA-binding protein
MFGFRTRSKPRWSLLLSGLLLAGTLVGCAKDASDTGDSSLRNQSFLAAGAGKADSVFNIQPGSVEAQGVLELVNTASLETLDRSAQVGLDVRAAENIVETRQDSKIDTLKQLDAISWVSKRAFKKLYNYAEANGYFPTDVGGEWKELAGETVQLEGTCTITTELVEDPPNPQDHRCSDGGTRQVQSTSKFKVATNPLRVTWKEMPSGWMAFRDTVDLEESGSVLRGQNDNMDVSIDGDEVYISTSNHYTATCLGEYDITGSCDYVADVNFGGENDNSENDDTDSNGDDSNEGSSEDDGENQSVYGIEPGSDVAKGILKVANTASKETLDESSGVGLDVRAAENIVEARQDSEIQSLEQLDAISWVSKRAIEKLRKYAEANGFSSSDGSAGSDTVAYEDFSFADGVDVSPHTAARTPEGNIVVAGVTKGHLLGASHPNVSKWKTFVAMVGPSGDKEWAHILESWASNHYDVDVEADDSGVYLSYYKGDDGKLQKFSFNGDSAWTKTFADFQGQYGSLLGYPTSEVELGDGEVMAVGTHPAHEPESITTGFIKDDGRKRWSFGRSGEVQMSYVHKDRVFAGTGRHGRNVILRRQGRLKDGHGVFDEVWETDPLVDTHTDDVESPVVKEIETNQDGETFSYYTETTSRATLVKHNAQGGKSWEHEVRLGNTDELNVVDLDVERDNIYVLATAREWSPENGETDAYAMVLQYENTLEGSELSEITPINRLDYHYNHNSFNLEPIDLSLRDGRFLVVSQRFEPEDGIAVHSVSKSD